MSDKKAQIMDAAISLFLSDGVGVSTARIAKEASVANGSLFNAFPNKQSLIDAIYLEGKLGMNQVFLRYINKPFNASSFYGLWKDYLIWGRGDQQLRKVMHLLFEAGLASEEVQKAVDEMTAPSIAWIEEAFQAGKMRGPNVGYIATVFFTHLNLVIDQDLYGEDEELAFRMLCDDIGLVL